MAQPMPPHGRRPVLGRCRGYPLLGLLEPGLAYALFNFGLRRTSAVDAAVLVSLESVVIAGFAAAFPGERLTPPLMVGAGLGVGGAVLLWEVRALRVDVPAEQWLKFDGDRPER